jgi:hypothetical protein
LWSARRGLLEREREREREREGEGGREERKRYFQLLSIL